MGNATDPRRLALAAAKALDDKKAVDVRVLKVHDLTVLTDYFVIASGTSTTHTAARSGSSTRCSPNGAWCTRRPRCPTSMP